MNVFKSLSGINIPFQIYGTAWKEDQTADLVEIALQKGFRGIDTACQPKHYKEPLVGKAIERSYQSGIKRSDLFLQTKFTSYRGQDPNDCPYDPRLSLEDQIKRSLSVSLSNLKTDYLDSYILHSPMNTWEETKRAWKVFEGFCKEGLVKQLGISNCYDLGYFKKLYDESEIKPSVLQNRFYKETNYDKELRKFCVDRGIYYQSFWTVNANKSIWQNPFVIEIAKKREVSPIQVFFRSLVYECIYPLYGTTNTIHMKEVIDLFSISLSEKERQEIRSIENY